MKSSFFYNIINEVKRLCNDEIRPKKMIYFSQMDHVLVLKNGSTTFTKMSIQLQEYLKKKEEWNPSNNIRPGTEFTFKLKYYLLREMEKKTFHCPEVILSDSSFPGEGEHKILPLLRKLVKKDVNSNIVIMSPDNDLISLGILTGKKNIFILRYIDYTIAEILKKKYYHKDSLIFIDLTKLLDEFMKEYTDNSKKDEMNVILDYNFILSMIGNDFIPVLPYMKIKNGGLDKLLRLYHQIFEKQKKYLIDKKYIEY